MVEAETVNDIINDVPYGHIKKDQQYVELTVDDTQSVENQIKNENKDFINTAIEFNKVDMRSRQPEKSQFFF